MPWFLFFFFLYHAFIASTYKKLRSALAMERTKPINLNKHQQKIIMRLVRRCCVRMLSVGNFAPLAPGAFCGGLRHSVAPGASGGTVASTLTSGC